MPLRAWGRAGAVLTALVAFPSCASAGAFDARTHRAPLPAREVERPLVLPRGWTALTVGVDRKRADRRWNGAGDRVALGGTWTRLRTAALIRAGILPGHELFGSAGWERAALGGQLGDAVGDGLGDVHLGWRTSLLQREPPLTSVVADARYKAPASPERQPLPLGTGTPELTIGVAARRALGALALTGRFQVVRGMAGLAGYLPAAGGGVRTLKPGDRVEGEVQALLQAGPLYGVGGARLGWRADTYVGRGRVPFPAERHLSRVPRSGGLGLDLTWRAFGQVSRGFGLGLTGTVPVRGEDFAFPFVEDLHPLPGATVGVEVELAL